MSLYCWPALERCSLVCLSWVVENIAVVSKIYIRLRPASSCLCGASLSFWANQGGRAQSIKSVSFH